MVSNEELTCRNCGARLKRYDNVLRIVRIKGRKTSWVKVNRFRCPSCGQIRRELPDYISPYKQYEAEVIRGVLEAKGIRPIVKIYPHENYQLSLTSSEDRQWYELIMKHTHNPPASKNEFF